jgi:hypothetical protein
VSLGMLTVRTARKADIARLVQFYSDWNDSNVLPRPEEEYKTAAQKGLLFFAEEGSKKIVAASGIFDLGDTRNPAVLEMGGTLVAPSFRGFALQSLFIELRVASVLVNEGVRTGLFTAVKSENAPSKTNVLKSGFVEWPTPDPICLDPCVSCKHKKADKPKIVSDCCCDYFFLDAQQKLNIAQNFVARIHKGKSLVSSVRLEAQGKKGVLPIKVTCRIAKETFPAIEEECIPELRKLIS